MRTPLRIDCPVLLAGGLALAPASWFAGPPWPWPADALPAWSVRSAWLALLDSLALLPGSAVLMSGWTIPDMHRLVSARGLIPVPVDLAPRSTRPDLQDLEQSFQACRAANIAPRCLLIAQLFGARHDLSAIAAWCRQRDLLLIEDAAQAWAPDGWWGSPEADVSLLSFGLIKTGSAGCGALVRMPDPARRSALKAVQARWPTVPGRLWRGRLRRLVAATLLCHPVTRSVLIDCLGTSERLGERVQTQLRGFPGTWSLDRFAYRPGSDLIRLLATRLRHPDRAADRRRRLAASRLRRRFTGSASQIAEPVAVDVGWVVPIRCRDPEAAARRIARQGHLAWPPRSMGVVPLPPHLDLPPPARAARLHRQTLFLPLI